MLHFFLFVPLVGLLAALLAGCMAGAPPGRFAPAETPVGLRVGDIVDTRSGKTISSEKLMEDLAQARVVYVGETHTSTEDHQVQLEISEGLYAKNHSLLLAMEMFPRQAQPALDRYTQSLSSEEAFLEESQWSKVWGFPFELYRPIVSFAQDRHLKILALNIPPSIAHKISRSGLDSLTPEERSKVAEQFNFQDIEHRMHIQEEYDSHAKEYIKEFQTFYEAQLAWEETMAETLARAVSSFSGKEQIVVVIGRGHINYRFGVPKRASDRVAHTYRTVVPLPVNYEGSMIDPKLADYVWVTKIPESSQRARLGVMVRALLSGDGLEVLGVLPDSPAAKAGIQKGDIIRDIDGSAVKSVEELHKVIAENSRVHEITIKRGNRLIPLTAFISH